MRILTWLAKGRWNGESLDAVLYLSLLEILRWRFSLLQFALLGTFWSGLWQGHFNRNAVKSVPASIEPSSDLRQNNARCWSYFSYYAHLRTGAQLAYYHCWPVSSTLFGYSSARSSYAESTVFADYSQHSQLVSPLRQSPALFRGISRGTSCKRDRRTKKWKNSQVSWSGNEVSRPLKIAQLQRSRCRQERKRFTSRSYLWCPDV